MNFLNQKTAKTDGVYIYVNGDVEFMDKYSNPSNRQVNDIWCYFRINTKPYITHVTRNNDHS